MCDDVQNFGRALRLPKAPITMSLVARLLGTASVLTWVAAAAPAYAQHRAEQSELRRQADARVPLLSNAEAWERLPETEEGGGGTLPAWARALANSLPRTTAAMLELDWLHREKSPLDPKLRGMMRWTVAYANRCDYTKADATADLCRAGIPQNEIEALTEVQSLRPEAEQAAIDFARKLTLTADSITDEEVARLVEWYGDKQVVAMVLLVAHANFQDRLFLSLGLTVEPSGPLPPLRVRFTKDQSSKPIAVPERKQPPDRSEESLANEAVKIDDAEWLSIDFHTLQSELEAQRDRPGRVQVPPWDAVLEWLPERARRNDPLRIKWSLVCVGYQPELALAWSACMRSFGEEAKQDRVFEESLFWVITRTIHCFY